MDAEIQITITHEESIVNIKTGGGSTVPPNEDISTKGIKGVNSVIIEDGIITVNSSDDAIHSNDEIMISGGTLNLATGDDGIHADHNITISGGTIDITQSYEGIESEYVIISGGDTHITADNDGINVFQLIEINDGIIIISAGSQGIQSDNEVFINSGFIEVTRCNEGIEAKSINIAGGSFIGYATDDALNGTMGRRTESNDGSQVIISGGSHYLNSSRGDSIDSNGTFTMTGGTVAACGPTSGANVAIDVNGSTTVSSGEFIATSSNSGMNEYPNSSSSQYSMAIMLTSAQPENSIICIKDSSGNELIKYRADRGFYSVIYSSPQLSYGATYTVLTGGTVSGGTELNNVISGGIYNGGSTIATITLTSSPTTTIGNFGGGPGGPF
jgi:hypothetical protein